MGCAVSKKDEVCDVVSLCRERKRLLKLAVEKRYAFADAQCKYNQSLYGMAMALRLFVARHSSESSPFLITFPSSSVTDDPRETSLAKPMFLQRRATEPIHETVACQPADSKVFPPPSKLDTKEPEIGGDVDGSAKEHEEKEEECKSEDGEGLCQHFYGGEAPPMPSPQRGFGWDFFNQFDQVRNQEADRFSQCSDEDLRVVRENEGIPELEEDEEKVASDSGVVKVNVDVDREGGGVTDVARNGDGTKMGQEERKGLSVIDTSTDGRELLEALKDIEDHFVRAYDSGLEISRMLEANRIQLQSGPEEIREGSNKLTRAITWNQSTLSRSSSAKSLLTSSSISSSTWTDFRGELFDDYGMEAGSHSLTLGRLYAWEKKLYAEVKAGEQTRKLYESKFSRFRKKDIVKDGLGSMDKSRSEVNELHTRIAVAVRSVESISDRIQKLADEELQPQLLELLHGLMRNWKIALESHETQSRVMLEVRSFNCLGYGKFSNDSHRLATVQLEAALDSWCCCLANYVTKQKAYIEALGGWLFKSIAPELEFYSRGRSLVPPCGINGPPLLVMCHNWLACLEKLPDKSVTSAIKYCGKNVHALWTQQGEEQQQKRKVDELAKELDRRALAFHRAERRTLESKICDHEAEANVQKHIEYLAERKNQLDMFRKGLDSEKAKQLASMKETQRVTIDGIQTGFSAVLDSLVKFSRESVIIYANLVTHSSNARAADRDENVTS